MPYSDYRPDLMGSAALNAGGSFEAGSLQTFTLVYTAGASASTTRAPLRSASGLPPISGRCSSAIRRHRAIPASKPPTARPLKPSGSSSATSGPGAGRSMSASSRISSRPATRSPSVSAIAALVLRASACRPIARGTSSSVCSPIRSRPMTMSRSRKARRSQSFRARLSVIAVLPTLARVGEPFRLTSSRGQMGQPDRLVRSACPLESDASICVDLPATVTLSEGSFATLVEGLSAAAPGDVQFVFLTTPARSSAVAIRFAIAPPDTALASFLGRHARAIERDLGHQFGA